jgi:hypothetical protein
MDMFRDCWTKSEKTEKFIEQKYRKRRATEALRAEDSAGRRGRREGRARAALSGQEDLDFTLSILATIASRDRYGQVCVCVCVCV